MRNDTVAPMYGALKVRWSRTVNLVKSHVVVCFKRYLVLALHLLTSQHAIAALPALFPRVADERHSDRRAQREHKLEARFCLEAASKLCD